MIVLQLTHYAFWAPMINFRFKKIANELEGLIHENIIPRKFGATCIRYLCMVVEQKLQVSAAGK